MCRIFSFLCHRFSFPVDEIYHVFFFFFFYEYCQLGRVDMTCLEDGQEERGKVEVQHEQLYRTIDYSKCRLVSQRIVVRLGRNAIVWCYAMPDCAALVSLILCVNQTRVGCWYRRGIVCSGWYSPSKLLQLNPIFKFTSQSSGLFTILISLAFYLQFTCGSNQSSGGKTSLEKLYVKQNKCNNCNTKLNVPKTTFHSIIFNI